LGPQFVGGGDTPDFGHAFSNRSVLMSVVQFVRLERHKDV